MRSLNERRLAGTFAILVFAQLAAGSSDNDLLYTLRDLRAATVASVASGRGEGMMDTRMEMVSQHLMESTPAHKIRFIFSGSTSLLFEYQSSPNDAKLLQSRLWNSTTLSYYYAGPDRPGNVLIKGRRPGSWLSTAELPGMSYMDITHNPVVFGDEGADFDGIANNPRVKIDRNGKSITTEDDETTPPNCPFVDTEHYAEKFDALLGGMLISFSNSHAHKDKNGQDSAKCEYSWEWARSGGFVLPTKYTADIVSYDAAGAVVSKQHCDIVFSRVELSDKPGATLTMDDMMIPAGTPVEDAIRQRTYIYAGDKTVPEKSSSTQPSL
ncbi:MAG: hypothetical protein ABSG31_07465 [Tepidisphaeraceae bacterium]|jgi:hypothetical protein